MKNIAKSDTFFCSVLASVWLIIYLQFTDQIWEMLWFMAIPAELWAVYFFVGMFIISIVFWIRKRNEFNHTYMPFFIIMLTIVVVYNFHLYKKIKLHYIGFENRHRIYQYTIQQSIEIG